MILAHVAGIPVEESVLQLAPAGAAILAAIAIASRASLRRVRRQLRPRLASALGRPDYRADVPPKD
jgi:hypothetical protein